MSTALCGRHAHIEALNTAKAKRLALTQLKRPEAIMGPQACQHGKKTLATLVPELDKFKKIAQLFA